MAGERKNYRQLERMVKGFANHRRIEILELLKKTPELSVIEITRKLRINFKTASEHIRRLAIAGLVIKRSAGNSVRHKVSNRGLSILQPVASLLVIASQLSKFLRTLE